MQVRDNKKAKIFLGVVLVVGSTHVLSLEQNPPFFTLVEEETIHEVMKPDFLMNKRRQEISKAGVMRRLEVKKKLVKDTHETLAKRFKHLKRWPLEKDYLQILLRKI